MNAMRSKLLVCSVSRIQQQPITKWPVTTYQLRTLINQSETSRTNQHKNHQDHKHPKSSYRAVLMSAAAGAGVLASGWYFWQSERDLTAFCKEKPIPPLTYEPGSVVKGKPTYTATEVQKHNCAQNRIWVTYKNGVYDVTDFVKWHPGGDKIMLAAGGSLEPYFALYAAHQTTEVMEIVESMRIGNIFDTKLPRIKDAYEHDPERSAVLKVNSEKPFNAEPPRSLLTDNFITPNDLFFVRNHLPVPVVTDADAAKYRLEGKVDRESKIRSLSISDIKKLPKHSIAVTVQCAGNRRAEMSSVKQVKGLTWDAGSISTATWTGCRLKDALEAMGFKQKDIKGKYVQFEGLDNDPTGTPYGSSIAAEVAWDPNRDVIIAYEMNGKPIPSDHGFPLRIVIPGVVGARNVKWLKRIVFSDEESHSHWQRKDYKTFNPSIDMNSANFDTAYSVQETPVQSAICEPSPSSMIRAEDEYVTIKGYAYSGGGRGIIRVDLSLDGGQTWINPELQNQEQSMYRSWAWTLWEATVPIPKNHRGKLDIVCKAIDSSHNVQPEKVEGIWNVRGLLNNSWHKVQVPVQ